MNGKEEILSKKVDLIHGHQFRDNDFVEDGIPIVKIGQLKLNGQIDLTDCSFVSNNESEKFSDYIIKKGDILMALTGATLGKTVRVTKDFGIIFQNYRVGKFQPVDNTINKDFLYYLLTCNDIQREMLLKINTAAQGNIGKADFEKIKIKYPEYNTQHQIGNILSTVDLVIEKTQTAITKYKAIKQGMLHDLFTRGIDITTGKLRPKYEDAPELYKETMLGWVLKEWDVERLEKTCEVNPLASLPGNLKGDDEVSFFKMEDVSNDAQIINRYTRKIKEVTKKGFTPFIENDILFAKNYSLYGKRQGCIGKGFEK